MFSQWHCSAKHKGQLSVLCMGQSSQGWHRRERSVRNKNVSFQLTQTRGDICEEMSQAVRGNPLPHTPATDYAQFSDKEPNAEARETYKSLSTGASCRAPAAIQPSTALQSGKEWTPHTTQPFSGKAQHVFLSYKETHPHETTCFWKIKSWEKKRRWKGSRTSKVVFQH